MMTIEEFKKAMEEVKLDSQPDEISREAKREAAMQAYLDDVVPISRYINEEFAKIEQRAKEKQQKEELETEE